MVAWLSDQIAVAGAAPGAGGFIWIGHTVPAGAGWQMLALVTMKAQVGSATQVANPARWALITNPMASGHSGLGKVIATGRPARAGEERTAATACDRSASPR